MSHTEMSIAIDNPSLIHRQNFQIHRKSTVSNPEYHMPPDPYPNPIQETLSGSVSLYPLSKSHNFFAKKCYRRPSMAKPTFPRH